MLLANRSLSARVSVDGKCSMTTGSALSAANGVRSASRHLRRSSRSLRSPAAIATVCQDLAVALGVEGMRAGRVVMRATFLTLATVLFVASLTLVYQSMRSVMDIGGSCASGGPYVNARPCPDNVVWAMPLGIFGMMAASGLSLLFTWSALFLALGWNFLDYGVNPPLGGTSWSWLICGITFVVMAVVPLIFLLMPTTFRWALWGPVTEVVPGAGRAGTHRSPADLVRMARGNDTKAPTPTRPSGPYAALTPAPSIDADEEPTA